VPAGEGWFVVNAVDEAAARHDASVEAETSSPHEAYATHPHWQPGGAPPGMPA
jgi:hypothetical protein